MNSFMWRISSSGIKVNVLIIDFVCYGDIRNYHSSFVMIIYTIIALCILGTGMTRSF